MTSLLAKMWRRLHSRRVALSIMIIGLDNSGKTSILESLISSKQNECNHLAKVENKSTEGAIKSTSVLKHADVEESSCHDSSNILPTVGYKYERIQYKGLTMTVLDFSGHNRYRNLWQEFYDGVDAIVFVIDSSDLIRLVVVRDELETMLSHPFFSTLITSNELSNQFPSNMGAISFHQKQLTISRGNLIQTPLESIPTQTITTKTSNTNQNFKKRSRRRIEIPILFLANKTDLPNSVDTEVIKKALNLSQLRTDLHPWFIQATSVQLNEGILDGFDWLVNQLSSYS